MGVGVRWMGWMGMGVGVAVDVRWMGQGVGVDVRWMKDSSLWLIGWMYRGIDGWVRVDGSKMGVKRVGWMHKRMVEGGKGRWE